MGFGKEDWHEQSQVNNITPTPKFRRNQRRRDWKQRPGVRARTTTAETGLGGGGERLCEVNPQSNFLFSVIFFSPKVSI